MRTVDFGRTDLEGKGLGAFKDAALATSLWPTQAWARLRRLVGEALNRFAA